MIRATTTFRIIALALLCACRSSTDREAPSDTGDYTLRTVNGLSLPFTTRSSRDGSSAVLEAETITLSGDGSVVRSLRGRSQLDGQFSAFTPFSFTYTGTFTRTGTAMQIVLPQTNQSLNGTLISGVLTLTIAPDQYQYRKSP